ncbi:hypothetical protein TSL6_02260 [Sulfurovum sp. TSL6]|uniref:hypothetical protein n=1 Tax=Sulfurovum sp. TSL6 TaxID=2826995 RepID=UPI001CC58548|nr:hypothetical protein [Sulfurovum sp. TSL6]GIT99719.1 hypothetical protein TSL6_02260 [Sulfurovum sp. TSL6]
MIESAVELWRDIIGKRNFDEKYYDFKEADLIKDRLRLPKDKSILKGLKKLNISLEEFIEVFFEANSSYTAMMNDLLNMFQEIGAKQTDVNLEISFEFDKNQPLTIDINNFKKQIERWKLIEKEVLISGATDIREYHRITGELLELNFPIQLNDNEREYNDFIIDLETTDDNEFNELIDKWKIFLNNFVQEVMKYGTDKASLAASSRKVKNNVHIELGIDRWPYQIHSQLQQITIKFDTLGTKNQQYIIKILDGFLNNIGVQITTIKERVKILDDYLELPFWKKRYELYSVWIFSQIYDVIKEHNHQVHVLDGKLSFPFKETHLATIYSDNNKNIYIYCEKRTPINNPIGSGRTKNIQPDYSFYQEPLSNVNSSILEIECKQYKKPNNDSFAKALIDYSNGRPKSQVFLVNHGEMKASNVISKAEKLESNFKKERCQLFSSIYANSTELYTFRSSIKGILFDNKVFSQSSNIEIQLIWAKEPQDLDLSVRCLDINNNTMGTVSYKNKNFEGMTFDTDIRTGSGPEEISLIAQENYTYVVQVENFSKEIPLIKSEAKVEISVNGQSIKQFDINSNDIETVFWKVCTMKTIFLDEEKLYLTWQD